MQNSTASCLAAFGAAVLLVAGAVFCRNYTVEEPVVEEAPAWIPPEDRYKTADYRISPYDSLIKAWSDSAGLDWRFVSAIIYHESNFRHDALSRRGAAGLMQMMPSTARAFGADSLLDAAQSVMAGTRYLQSLSKNYGSVAANATERQKFILAAYNAGAGRMRDLINFARHKGVDPGYWDNLVELIPEMRTDSILTVDTVKLGKFQGHETIDFVEAVMARYEKYMQMAPGAATSP